MIHPPKLWLRILRWLCREDYLEEIEGDLLELFEKRLQVRSSKASLMFAFDVLRSMRMSNLKRPKTISWSHLSLKKSWRSISRQGRYSVLNGLNLTIGATFFLLFAMYARQEFAYDHFHSNADRIYRVSLREFLELGAYATTSYPIGPALLEDFPEVEAMTRFGTIGRQKVNFGEHTFFEEVRVADADFFKIFDFHLIAGNAANALTAPNSVAISESIAAKYFGDKNPIGKVLRIGTSEAYHSTITAVFEDFKPFSQIQAQVIVSYSTQHKLYSWLSDLWQQMPSNYTYILLHGNASPAHLTEKLGTFQSTYVADLERGGYLPFLIPLTDVHFYEGLQNELGTNSKWSSLWTFALIALVVLAIGIFNYVNLSVSRNLLREREMGVRKVLGAGRKTLISELLLEAALLAGGALAIAVAVGIAVLPFFNSMASTNFVWQEILTADLIGLIGLLWLVITFSAGLTPAAILSKVNARDALGGRTTSGHMRGSGIRSVFLAFQYSATICLLIFSLVIFKQLKFVNESIWPSEERINLVMPLSAQLADKYEVLSQQLESQLTVKAVAASSHVPGYYGDSWPIRLGEHAVPVQTENFVVSANYLDVMPYELLAGRFLSVRLRSDSASFVINETAVRHLGFSTVAEALGQTIYFGGDNRKQGKIIGVTKDFHFESLHHEIQPAVFQFSPYSWMKYNFLVVSVTKQDISAAIEVIEEQVARLDPAWLVETSVFSENFKKLHLTELRQGKLAAVFSAVAVILGCLGQFGLLMHSALSRKKDFAIRRVLGAGIKQIWRLLAGSYLRYFLVAILVGLPIAWIFSTRWLQAFAYRTEVGFDSVLVGVTISVFVLLVTVTLVTSNAVQVNPVQNLKDD